MPYTCTQDGANNKQKPMQCIYVIIHVVDTIIILQPNCITEGYIICMHDMSVHSLVPRLFLCVRNYCGGRACGRG